MKVRSIYGGTTYKVQPFCGCIALYAVCEHCISNVPDYFYPTLAHMLADNFKEVK